MLHCDILWGHPGRQRHDHSTYTRWIMIRMIRHTFTDCKSPLFSQPIPLSFRHPVTGIRCRWILIASKFPRKRLDIAFVCLRGFYMRQLLFPLRTLLRPLFVSIKRHQLWIFVLYHLCFRHPFLSPCHPGLLHREKSRRRGVAITKQCSLLRYKDRNWYILQANMYEDMDNTQIDALYLFFSSRWDEKVIIP